MQTSVGFAFLRIGVDFGSGIPPFLLVDGGATKASAFKAFGAQISLALFAVRALHELGRALYGDNMRAAKDVSTFSTLALVFFAVEVGGATCAGAAARGDVKML